MSGKQNSSCFTLSMTQVFLHKCHAQKSGFSSKPHWQWTIGISWSENMLLLPTKPQCHLPAGLRIAAAVAEVLSSALRNGASLLCLLVLVSPAVERTLRSVRGSTIEQDGSQHICSCAHMLFLLMLRNIFSTELQSNVYKNLALKFQRNLPSWVIFLIFFAGLYKQ